MNRWHPLPAELYALVEHSPATVLLENSNPAAGEQLSRLFCSPLRVLAVNEPAQLAELFAEIESAVAAGHHVAGFFTYECGICFEPKAAIRPTRAGQPLAWFGVYRRNHLFDHRTGVFPHGEPPELARFRGANLESKPDAQPLLETRLDIAGEEYAARIAAIHEWIRAGDIYQLNFTFPLRVRALGGPAALYAELRRRQPVEFGALLHWLPGRHIFSFSPELFFRIEEEGGGRRITTRPMKGTAPRGRTTAEDRRIAEWLRSDPKNRSENVMIVDLLRNDLGRLCAFGSVRTEDLFAVERYRTLWQMTSTVTGRLRPECGYRQIFRALFPSGSVTGAPKVRAMQLLGKIEQKPRGVYTGAIGFFSRERTVFNVAIRTLELEGQCGTMGVGSGIVIDSVAAEEFRECQLKAAFLTEPAERFPDNFSLVETLLWRGGFPLIELHLERLLDSASYFDFPCDRAEVKQALLAHAGAFLAGESRKVRLLLDCIGTLLIENEILSQPANTKDARLSRVCIAQQRTDPHDPMLFHKTTHRPLYAESFKTATQSGFDDVLFLNHRLEVTEGAVSNVFVEKGGRLYTPPLECGLLPGVFRRHLLDTRPGVEERVLYPGDLRQADAVYLANAVRGLRRVSIDWEN